MTDPKLKEEMDVDETEEDLDENEETQTPNMVQQQRQCMLPFFWYRFNTN